MLVIETERLVLRLVEQTDQFALMKVLGDPKVMEFSGGVLDAAEISEWIDKYQLAYRKTGRGVFSAIERATQKLVGYCGLFDYANVDGHPEVEVGYRLATEAWGKGYATEAAGVVLDHAHASLGIGRVVAMIDPNNVGSIKVAEKLGMVYEKEVMMPDYTHPDLLYVHNRS